MVIEVMLQNGILVAKKRSYFNNLILQMFLLV